MAETKKHSKTALAETPSASNAKVHMPAVPVPMGLSLVQSLSGSEHVSRSPCHSPRRPRHQRTACKPSPARNAAAVILATLLGSQGQGQGQEQGREQEQEQGSEASPFPRNEMAGNKSAGKQGKRAVMASTSNMSNMKTSESERPELDGGNGGSSSSSSGGTRRNQVHIKAEPDPDPWPDREGEAGRSKRQRANGTRDGGDWDVRAHMSHAGQGQESRRLAQWHREALRPGREFQGSPERNGGVGTPASAAVLRRASPLKHSLLRGVSHGERLMAGVKREGLSKGTPKGKTASPSSSSSSPAATATTTKAGAGKGGKGGAGADGRLGDPNNCDVQGSAMKDAREKAASGPSLSSPEGTGGGGPASGDEFSYNYCRKDKSLGLLCGRFVDVYGRQQHLKSTDDGDDGENRGEERDDEREQGEGEQGEGGGRGAAPASGSGEENKGVIGRPTEGMVELDRAALELGVARRRIYDVINILESLCVVSRARKNTYRWHGKSNLPQTLRQLQKTAALVFPDEVVRNGMANCLQVGKPKPHTAATLDAGDAIDARDAGAGSCLGGPRPDGQKEKSLGGLCRRFVQLFLVGNDVVSVAAAAEKLSEPEDVATGNVVYKTRARRLYDIANALAALGLVEKVRSQESHKPNFRWIGVPVRELPTYDPSNAATDATDFKDSRAMPLVERSVVSRKRPCLSPPAALATCKTTNVGHGHNHHHGHLKAKSPTSPSPSPSPFKISEQNRVLTSSTGKRRLSTRELDSSGKARSPARSPASSRNRRDSAARHTASRPGSGSGLGSGVKRQQKSSPLSSAGAESTRKGRNETKSSMVRRNDLSSPISSPSPSAKRSSIASTAVTPRPTRQTNVFLVAAEALSPGEASDAGSPVDPRKVMRADGDGDGADDDGDGDYDGERHDDGGGDHDGDGDVREARSWNMMAFGDSARDCLASVKTRHQSAAAAAAVAAAAAAASLSPSPSPSPSTGRSRSRSVLSQSSAAKRISGVASPEIPLGERMPLHQVPVPVPTAGAPSSHVLCTPLQGQALSSDSRKRKAFDNASDAAAAADSEATATAAALDGHGGGDGNGDGDDDRVRSPGEGEKKFRASGKRRGMGKRKEAGSPDKDVDSVSSLGSSANLSLSMKAPDSPKTVRRKHVELLDAYMEMYTEQWNRWREAGPDGDVSPPCVPPYPNLFYPPYTAPTPTPTPAPAPAPYCTPGKTPESMPMSISCRRCRCSCAADERAAALAKTLASTSGESDEESARQERERVGEGEGEGGVLRDEARSVARSVGLAESSKLVSPIRSRAGLRQGQGKHSFGRGGLASASASASASAIKNKDKDKNAIKMKSLS